MSRAIVVFGCNSDFMHPRCGFEISIFAISHDVNVEEAGFETIHVGGTQDEVHSTISVLSSDLDLNTDLVEMIKKEVEDMDSPSESVTKSLRGRSTNTLVYDLIHIEDTWHVREHAPREVQNVVCTFYVVDINQ